MFWIIASLLGAITPMEGWMRSERIQVFQLVSDFNADGSSECLRVVTVVTKTQVSRSSSVRFSLVEPPHPSVSCLEAHRELPDSVVDIADAEVRVQSDVLVGASQWRNGMIAELIVPFSGSNGPGRVILANYSRGKFGYVVALPTTRPRFRLATRRPFGPEEEP